MTTQTNRPAPRRWAHIAVAAALGICLLTTTALAAPILYNSISGTVNNSWAAATPTDEQGDSQEGTTFDITVDITLNEDAPREIETYYMPQLPAEYEQSFGYAYGGYDYDQLDVITYFWSVSENEKAGIHFFQHSASFYETEGMGFNVFLTDGQKPVLEPVTLGTREGFLICAPDDLDGGTKYFCWTDGDYVFYMRFPHRFTDAQISEIIASVQPVDDIRPYLVSMTHAEIEKTFADRP